MTPRQRYLATLLHHTPDRISFEPGDARKSTLAAWHRQGLPPTSPLTTDAPARALTTAPRRRCRPPTSHR